MADYYWVGGSGNWSSFATRWATTSGGSTFHTQAPTSADNVFFDAGSDAGGIFTVTLDVAGNCANFNANTASPLDFTMTFAGSQQLNVYGSLTLPTTRFTWSKTGRLDFLSTSAGNTILSNGISLATLTDVRFNGVGGEWTLGSALTFGGTFIRGLAGTLITGNFNMSLTTGGFLAANSATTAFTLTLGAMTLACQYFDVTNPSNFTINPSTSTIQITPPVLSYNLGSKTYYNFTINGATGNQTISGSNTFNNFTTVAPISARNIVVTFNGNQTINGTFSLNSGATNPNLRYTFASDTNGTPRTITAAAVSLTNTDFRDITAAGAATRPWTGTSLGDCKGNTDITFSVAKTVYWNLAGAQSWSATAWATTNNGSPAIANFPLAQDTAIFTEAGAAGTVTVNSGWNIGTIQMADGVSNRTTAFTLATGTTTPVIYGNVTFFSALTLTGTGALTFAGRTIQTITSAGVAFTQPWTINSPSGAVTLGDNTTIGSSLATTLTTGTFNLNGKNYSTGTFVNTGTATRAITFGTSATLTIAGSGATAWNASGSGFTSTGTTSTISMTSASAKTFVGGGYTYAAALNQGGAGTLTISGSNTFQDITNAYGATGATTITFTAGTTQTVSAFTASGTSGKLLTLNSSSAGTRFNLSDPSGSVNVSFCSIIDSNATGGARWNAYTENGNVNVGNNVGWRFSERGGLSPIYGLSSASGLSVGVGLVGNI